MLNLLTTFVLVMLGLYLLITIIVIVESAIYMLILKKQNKNKKVPKAIDLAKEINKKKKTQ